MTLTWKEYIDNHQDRFLDELKNILSIPSISTLSEHKKDMYACSEAIKAMLLKSGCDKAAIMETEGHPVVYSEKIIDKKAPTILVYGHYDVQPADTTDQWQSKPFEPVIKDGKIFARGASDDKGQVHMHIKALEVMLKTGTLKTNVKFLIEGEEEIGSPHLQSFIQKNKKMLDADIVLISDNALINVDTPSLEIGFRGSCMLEVEMTGANRDLHSGTFGGAVANPILILSKILAALHDKNNHITVPGFYDDIIPVSEEERALIKTLPHNEEEYKKDLGIKNTWGEEGYTTLERTTIRPTLEINGIWGGYIGQGMKTVLPSKAYAKITSRLVPGQVSETITKKIADHLRSLTPSSVDINIISYPGSEPYIIDANSAAFISASKAMEKVFGMVPLRVRDGGSLPLCYQIEKELGVKSILMGFGLPDDNIHGVNEKFSLNNYFKGIETILYFHQYFLAGQ